MDQEETERIISIVAPDRGIYSETFIQAHIDNLPAKVKALYGYPLPRETGEGKLLYAHSNLSRRIHKIKDLFWGGDSKEFSKTRAIERYLLRNQVDAVLAEYGHTGVAMMELCNETGIPLIVHFHGHDAYHSKILDNEGQRYSELFEISAALVVVSKDMHRQLIDLGAPSEKVFVNPNGVAVNKFIGADPAQADPIFLSVGRFVDKKAPHLTLLAFNQVLKSYPGSGLIMIGDGPLLEACQQLAQALKISYAVEFRGALAHDKVAKEMQLARAFVQHSIRTSFGDSEGLPVAILEASAAGLPVVATRHAGITDVIQDGETGYLVEERDMHGMAVAMSQLVQNPSLAAKFGKMGREQVEKNFTIEKSIDGLWKIISAAIDMNSRNSTFH